MIRYSNGIWGLRSLAQWWGSALPRVLAPAALAGAGAAALRRFAGEPLRRALEGGFPVYSTAFVVVGLLLVARCVLCRAGARGCARSGPRGRGQECARGRPEQRPGVPRRPRSHAQPRVHRRWRDVPVAPLRTARRPAARAAALPRTVRTAAAASRTLHSCTRRNFTANAPLREQAARGRTVRSPRARPEAAAAAFLPPRGRLARATRPPLTTRARPHTQAVCGA